MRHALPARRESVPPLDHRAEERGLDRFQRAGRVARQAHDVGLAGHELRVRLAQEPLHARHRGFPAGVAAGAQLDAARGARRRDPRGPQPPAVVGAHHHLVADARLAHEAVERLAQRREVLAPRAVLPPKRHRHRPRNLPERQERLGQRPHRIVRGWKGDPLHVHVELVALGTHVEVGVAATRGRALEVDHAAGLEEPPRQHRLGHRAQEEVLARAGALERLDQPADLPAGHAAPAVPLGRAHPGEDLGA
ncbi:MAG: hypothetical protein ACKOV8_07830 [Phycisphaerales bacterium]